MALRDPAQRVSPRARWAWAIGALGRSLVAAAVLVGVSRAASVDVAWWGWLLLGVALAAYVVGVAQWRYAVHRWEVTDSAVYTQTGWWSRERRIAPMSRIQTVDLVQGALARLLGLATVTVTTASAAGALQIVGLDAARAQALVDELTLRADAADGDAT